MTVSGALLRKSPIVGPAAAARLGVAQCGGKAAALARLTAAGERVPEWVLLPADALETHLIAAGSIDRVQHELETLASAATDGAALTKAAQRLQQIVNELPLEAALTDALADIAVSLGGGPFAVRSSAVGEDGDRHSFAGQLDTVLDVDGDVDALADAVRRCWRGAFGARVLDYRTRSGSVSEAARIAVIIQRMIPGDVSGVLFTIDPVMGDAERMRVSACAGLGEALVSGAADADEYVLRRDGAVVEMRLASAPGVGACATSDGRVREAASSRLLSTDALRAIAVMGQRVEHHEGGARDIEWTMRDGELWVLQARPVTSAAPMGVSADDHRIVWDNSNIQESYCGVTTPLTFSFARAAYASVYEQTMRTLGVPERTIAAHRPMLQNLLGLLHGRVYYNLNNWYRGLLLLPAFGRNKADMERMMGVEEPVDFVVDDAPGTAERLHRVPRLARTFLGLQRAFMTLDRDAARFLATFDDRIAAIDRASLGNRPLAELMELLAQLRRECIERWVTPIVNDFRVMMAVGRLRRFVAREAAPADVDRLMQTLLGGADVAASAGPAMLMLRLSGLARENPTVLAALRERAPERALADARTASPAFAATLDELLRVYGDRCMGELKLESRSLHDDPAFIVRMLRNYLVARAANDEDLAASARQVRRGAERDAETRLGVWGAWGFRRALATARGAIRAREAMRLARTRLFGVHRDIYRAIGARLAELGRLERADDVLYLTTREIDEFWEGTAVSADLAGLVRTRRAEFAAYERESPPNRIITTGLPHALVLHAVGRGAGEPAAALALPTEIDPPFVERGGLTRSMRVLRGLGCSAGIVEGIVRIVRSAEDDLAIDGHILVAPRTDPGWAPLFPCAAGIIVERGSLLSHSAVLARELGLPAVVGVPGVVDMLRDGEHVRIDGAAGTIERLDVP